MAQFTTADAGYKHTVELFTKKLQRFFPTKAFADLIYSKDPQAEYQRQVNLGAIKEPNFWVGSGVPALATVPNGGQAGDVYIRTDTPSTANQRIYMCSVAGTSAALGTFVAVV